MVYQLNIKRKAMKALEELHEPFYSSIKAAIYDLIEEPRPSGCKKLKGRSGYRIRVGDYRVIYEIFDNQLIVDVIDLGHRKDIYE